MDGDSVQNVPLTFAYVSDPSSTCSTDLAQCCFLGSVVCGWERHCPGSELGEIRALSLWWEISLPHGQSPTEAGEKKADVRLGEFPTILPPDRLCASGKTGYRIYPLGLSPYNLSLVRFGCENRVPYTASESVCPSV